MIKIFFLFLFFVISFHETLSQYQNILISNNPSPFETSIMIDPQNTNNIVAGSNVFPYWTLNYYVSTNSGLNWIGGILNSTQVIPGPDPVILVDGNHNYFYVGCSALRAIPNVYPLYICKSTNGGFNWSEGFVLNINGYKVSDKPWGCVDLTNSTYRNSIYVTWSQYDTFINPTSYDSSIILFSKSTNSGLSFTAPKRISKRAGTQGWPDDLNTMEGAVPCVGPNGEVYVAWAGPVIIGSQYAIYFNKSIDGGNTWLDSERVAAIQPGGSNYNIPGIIRCNGLPVISCDLSNSSHRGTIYINFSDQRNGPTDTDIWLIKSTNGGLNWSSAVRVNDDSPGNQQFLTWMCVDQSSGYLYFVFYDERGLTNNQTNVYAARSTDGGYTFQNTKVSSSPFTLNSSYFIGDYINISATQGHIRPIWTRINGTSLAIYTAIIDTFLIGIQPISKIIPMNSSLSQNYPNPFNPITKIKFQIAREGLTKLIIFDILGREVSTLVNESLKPGEYETEWDASNFASGVYFYKLKTNSFNITKRMVLIK